MKRNFIVIASIVAVLSCYFFIYNFNKKNEEVVIANNSINKKVCPIGRICGLKMYTKGVLVIGMSEIEGEDGKEYKPYENSKITEGDFIKEINGKEINNTKELIDEVNNSNGEEIELKVQSESNEFYCNLKPIKNKDGNFMLGLWVRDAACGVGTLTYYCKENNSFGTLGHGLYDVDTEKLLDIKNGDIVTGKIVSIVKGEKNKPGEIRGIIDNGIKIGEIEKNTALGVYGKVTNVNYINEIALPEVSVASRNEIKLGKAKAICQLENDSKPVEYEIEIKKIYKTNSKNNKSMLIKVTDERLLEKTGGIIPGMSGTPIIQNGKFIGAVTNVLVSNPTLGYAIFPDLMLQ